MIPAHFPPTPRPRPDHFVRPTTDRSVLRLRLATAFDPTGDQPGRNFAPTGNRLGRNFAATGNRLGSDRGGSVRAGVRPTRREEEEEEEVKRLRLFSSSRPQGPHSRLSFEIVLVGLGLSSPTLTIELLLQFQKRPPTGPERRKRSPGKRLPSKEIRATCSTTRRVPTRRMSFYEALRFRSGITWRPSREHYWFRTTWGSGLAFYRSKYYRQSSRVSRDPHA